MLEVRELKKYYKTKGGVIVHALDGVSIQFPETGMVFLLGKSGSGKSTLLNVSGGLDRPDSGEVIVKGKSSKDFTQSDFDSYRNTFIGFVFQEYNILNEFNVETNIALALELQGKRNDPAAVDAILEQVDLKGLGKRKPNTLSGGQKQRIAIARALIKEPEIIMADEPTGALDSTTGKQVFDTLKKLSETKLVIVVSHDRDFAEEYGDRIIELKDGKVLTDHTKTFLDSDDVSKNIKKIGEDTVQIKDISKITDEELGKILKSIKGSGEVIITKNEENITTFKKAAKITDEGAKQQFVDTDVENINIKTYDGSQTKFIKSRLPARHALRMGASNLKIKPIRLAFTMLLSVISFIMFGISSTMMTYNPSFSMAKGLQAEPYEALTLKKQYKRLYQNYVTYSDGTTEINYQNNEKIDTLISERDIEKLNDNQYGLKFAGYYSGDFSLDSNFAKSSSVDYYNVTKLSGICDCGSKYMEDNGFIPLAGNYPANSSEIAITEYMFEVFRQCGYKIGNLKIDNPSDLIGKDLEIGFYNYSTGVSKTLTLKISGVYRTDNGWKNSMYNVLKEKEHKKISMEEYYQLVEGFDDIIKTGFSGLGYVSDDFYSKYAIYLKPSNGDYSWIDASYLSSSRLLYGAFYDEFMSASDKSDLYPGEGYSVDFLSERQLRENSSVIGFYDAQGNRLSNISISDNEAYLNLSSFMLSNSIEGFATSEAEFKVAAIDVNGNSTFLSENSSNCEKNSSRTLKIDYDTLELHPEPTELYDNVGSVIVDADGKVILYTRVVYTNESDLTNYKFESESGYEIPRCAYFDKNKNLVGFDGDGCIEKVNFSTYFYDKTTGNVYSTLEVDGDGIEFYLKADPDTKVEIKHDSYFINDNGKYNTDYDGLPRNGFFVNKETGRISVNKEPNSLFADSFFVDTNGNVYIGTELRYYDSWKTEDSEHNITYTCYPTNWPLGYVAQNYGKSLGYLESNEEAVKAVARYFVAVNQLSDINSLSYRYPDVDLDGACSKEFDDNDLKTIIAAYKNALVTYPELNNYLTDCYAIVDGAHNVTELEITGFYILDGGCRGGGDIALSNEWEDKADSKSYNSGDYYGTRYVTDYIVQEDAHYSNIITLTSKSTDHLKFLLQEYPDDSLYVVKNRVSDTITFLTDLFLELEEIFLWIGGIFAVFSGLLLLNFISTSIAAKQREIGILRAVGARGADVFKIFFSESGIICGICVLLSTIASALICVILNKKFAEGISIQIFDFGLINFGFILVAAFAVGIIGTLLPVIKASRRPPVESIRAL